MALGRPRVLANSSSPSGRRSIRIGTLRSGGLDRVLRDDVEGEFDADLGVQLDLHLVLAEGLDWLAEMDAALLDVDAGGGELGMDVVRRDGAEQLATLACLHGDGDAGLLDLLAERLRAVELLGFAETAGLLEGFDVLAVGLRERNGHALGQEIIARVAGADFDLVAFGAKAVDRFEEENFAVSHGECRPAAELLVVC